MTEIPDEIAKSYAASFAKFGFEMFEKYEELVEKFGEDSALFEVGKNLSGLVGRFCVANSLGSPDYHTAMKKISIPFLFVLTNLHTVLQKVFRQSMEDRWGKKTVNDLSKAINDCYQDALRDLMLKKFQQKKELH